MSPKPTSFTHSYLFHALIWRPFSPILLPLYTLWGAFKYPSLKAYLHQRRRHPGPSPKHLKIECARHFNDPSQGTPGTTLPTSIAQLAPALQLSATDHLIDLGSGMGETIITLSQLTGCKSTGIEAIPSLHQTATTIANAIAPLPITFHCQTIEDTPLDAYTHIYIAWTTFPKEQVDRLTQRLKQLPNTPIIITTSYPIPDTAFTCISSHSCIFSWGVGTLYIQQKNHI